MQETGTLARGSFFPRRYERAHRKYKTVVFTRLCDANITFIQNLSTLPVCFGGVWGLVCRQKEPSLHHLPLLAWRTCTLQLLTGKVPALCAYPMCLR